MNKFTLCLIGASSIGLFSSTALAKHGGDAFDRLDADNDGEITEADAAAHEEKRQSRRAKMLESADSNNDGAVSREEFEAFRAAKRAERNPDKNGDGVVDKTEFLNSAEKRFDKMDKNDDGVLSEEERHRRRGHDRHGR